MFTVMPQKPPTTFRIEDLKARLKLEPKSRLFYPLAEELRKLDRFEDAEKILRNGLTVHSSYISAWISLGRVLQEQQKHDQAVEPLHRACTLDPGNVVAARLLGDSYYAVGQLVEAIKKYKLVRALLPADESVREVIARLEVEIHRGAPVAPAAPVERAQSPVEMTADQGPRTSDLSVESTAVSGEAPSAAAFTIVTAKDQGELERKDETGPFPVFEPEPQLTGPQDVFSASGGPATQPTASQTSPEPLMTKTMADLYQQQGHTKEAGEIYGKLAGQSAAPGEDGSRKQVVHKLESWLSKVGRK